MKNTLLMNKTILSTLATLFTSAVLATQSGPADAAIVVSEVAAWSSSNASFAADWFELTNTGDTAINITGWKMDDSSNSFASAVTLHGITSIAAGESVIFTESASSLSSAFANTWFGGNLPAVLQIGNYSGSGVGLSASGDAVNIFNAAGVSQANVSFGASSSSSPFRTFDNSAGASGLISQLSQEGVNGAKEIVETIITTTTVVRQVGSPGTVAAVPEPESYALFVAGLGLVGFSTRRKTN